MHDIPKLRGISFVSWRDGAFFNDCFADICAGRRVLFCSLPKTHDFVHHGYVKYIRSLAKDVDGVYLVTGSRFSLATIASYWNDLPGLYDASLDFDTLLAEAVNRSEYRDRCKHNWKYQALFDDGQLRYFADYHVTDSRNWLLSRMKTDKRWRNLLVHQDAEAIKALKLLLAKPEFVPGESAMSMFKDTLAPMLMFDNLWPNGDLENLLRTEPK